MQKDNIIELRRALPSDDVVATLRLLADQIEAGDPEWPVTTAILVLANGGSESRPDENGIVWAESSISVHGMGPRVDPFTTRGVLMMAMQELGV